MWSGSRDVFYAADGIPPVRGKNLWGVSDNSESAAGRVKFFPDRDNNFWRLFPSIHMPRWASRITLEITGVRAQRLQEISDDDIEAEGTAAWVCDGGQVNAPCPGFDGKMPNSDGRMRVKPNRLAFSSMWNTINAKRGLGWDANPWVWAITFRRVEGEVV